MLPILPRTLDSTLRYEDPLATLHHPHGYNKDKSEMALPLGNTHLPTGRRQSMNLQPTASGVPDGCSTFTLSAMGRRRRLLGKVRDSVRVVVMAVWRKHGKTGRKWEAGRPAGVLCGSSGKK